MAEDHDHRDPKSRLHAPRKPRAKKNTRRWCRGKVGVEHETQVAMYGWAVSLGRSCDETSIGHWVMYEDHRSFEPTGRTYWSCHHIEQCSNCGKNLRSLREDECPDRQRISA